MELAFPQCPEETPNYYKFYFDCQKKNATLKYGRILKEVQPINLSGSIANAHKPHKKGSKVSHFGKGLTNFEKSNLDIQELHVCGASGKRKQVTVAPRVSEPVNLEPREQYFELESWFGESLKRYLITDRSQF